MIVKIETRFPLVEKDAKWAERLAGLYVAVNVFRACASSLAAPIDVDDKSDDFTISAPDHLVSNHETTPRGSLLISNQAC